MQTQSLPNLESARPVSLPGHDISIKEMYSISMRNNTVWGIDGYKVPAHYADSRKLAQIASGKFKQKAPRALNKPDYLTDTLRYAKTPAPNHYNIVKPWFDESKKGKQPAATKKGSYIDAIIEENKRRPKPGPGAYNLRETDEQAKKKINTREVKGSDRTNFLCEMEYVSNAIPGPGNYNPRQIQPKIKENRMKPEDWKKKHAEQRKNSKSNFPDVGTYRPEPVAYKTLGKMWEDHKEKKDITKVKLWGTATRLSGNDKKDKKKNMSGFPGPGQYAMTAIWNGKDAKDKKDKNWMNKITKGIEKSIYYS